MNEQATRQTGANPYVLLVITAFLWGGNAVAGKLAVGHVSPFLLTWLRWLVAVSVVLPFALPHLKRDWPAIRKHWIYLAALGVTGFAVFNNLMYLALKYTSAINVAIEQAAMPLIVFVLNFLLFRMRVTGFQLFGYTLTLAGVVITATRGDVAGLLSESLNIGDALMIAAIMFYGIYTVFLRNKPQIHLLSFISIVGTAAFVGTTPLVGYEYATGSIQWPDWQGWGVVLYAALLPSLVSQLFWVIGLEKIGSNRGGVFINLVPVFGALLAVLVLGEAFQAYHAVGMVLVLGGITLAQKTIPVRPV